MSFTPDIARAANGMALGDNRRGTLELGGSDEGNPSVRDSGFYVAYFRDLDGNKFCLFCAGTWVMAYRAGQCIAASQSGKDRNGNRPNPRQAMD